MQIHPENIPRPPSRRLTVRYVVALSVVGLLSILGQFLVQVALMRQSSDSHVINIAGRQRMLSQKVSKAALAIQVTTDPAVRRERLKELRDALTLWERSHLGLLHGDAEMSLPGTNSAEVKRMFTEFEPHHQAMLEAAQGLLAAAAREGTGAPADSGTARFVDRILAMEAVCLVGMNEIVFQYDREARARIDRLKQVELMLLSITLIVLLLIGLVLFRPVVRKIGRTIAALERTDGELRKLNQELEQRVVERTAELQRSAERFRQMLEALPVAIRVVQKGVVAFCNSADAVLHGYEGSEEMIGTDAFLYFMEEDVARLRDYADRRAAGDPTVPTRYEARAKRQDGSVIPVELVVTRIIYGGQPASLTALYDLSERKRLQLYESILPVCCVCGKVRDDTGTERGKGSWESLQAFVTEHSDTSLSHTFCPPCYQEYRQQQGLPPEAP
jgi:PAS domain S-box-containing protein